MPRSGDRTARRAESGELIGLDATVVASNHPPLVGVTGRVVDETFGTLVFEAGGREVVVPKRGQRFRFALAPGEDAELDGVRLETQPEERIKLKRK